MTSKQAARKAIKCLTLTDWAGAAAATRALKDDSEAHRKAYSRIREIQRGRTVDITRSVHKIITILQSELIEKI